MAVIITLSYRFVNRYYNTHCDIIVTVSAAAHVHIFSFIIIIINEIFSATINKKNINAKRIN